MHIGEEECSFTSEGAIVTKLRYVSCCEHNGIVYMMGTWNHHVINYNPELKTSEMTNYVIETNLQNSGICCSPKGEIYVFRQDHFRKCYEGEITVISDMPMSGSWWGPVISQWYRGSIYILRNDETLYRVDEVTGEFTNMEYPEIADSVKVPSYEYDSS